MVDFLLELLSEEIPARMQLRAADDLKRLVCERIERAGLSFEHAVAYVTPRRLALIVDGLPETQPDQREERKGPRVGASEAAIRGFLKASGLATVDLAEIRATDKGEFYFSVSSRAGQPTATVLAAIVREVISSFPWPKSMRWGDGELRWVRPLQNILAVLDGEPLPLSIPLRQPASPATPVLIATAKTCGHRFLAADDWFPVARGVYYLEKLERAKVIADQTERRERIRNQAEACAAAEGLRLAADPALLDEVTGLVEWPLAMVGRIDETFMDVPQEVLITSMRAHQKYFPLLGAEGRLAPRFVVIANIVTADSGRAIVAGNERVLRARLSDAKFFWDQDRKRPLADRIDKLKERVFHARLGSDFERVERLRRLAGGIAGAIGADVALAERAALLSKADLASEMVGEFPELQGTMGRYYALNDGEADITATAIAEHYAPQGPSDRCPTAPVSVAVALADKIDTLVGFFGIDEKPTGSKDPFALRRAALAIIRLIVENGLRLPLKPVIAAAWSNYRLADGAGGTAGTGVPAVEILTGDLLTFFADRLKVHLREHGIRHDLIAAVFASGAEDDLVKLLARVSALKDFLDTDDGANLLTAYRRASNIVRIEENKDNASYHGEANQELLSQPEEAELHRSLRQARGQISEALAKEKFHEAMSVLAGLRSPVDEFFDKVQVNCADAVLRINRLRLLSQIRSALGGVGDFSQIDG